MLLRFLLLLQLLLLGACRSVPQIPTNYKDSEVINKHYKLHRLHPSFFASNHQNIKQKSHVSPVNLTKEKPYRVGPGDILSITVWGHSELSLPEGAYRSAKEAGTWVSDKGTIFYPFIGKVQVAGKTVNEIRDDLTQKLSAYIKKPQMDVKVASFQSQKVYVTGQVETPGTQPITNVSLTLLDAINKAGGLTQGNTAYSVYLTRNHVTEKISLNEYLRTGLFSQNLILQDGDVIHVPGNDGEKVFVLGEVGQQSVLRIDSYGLSLTEALAKTGGVGSLTADATGIFVIRARQNFTPKDGASQIFSDVYQLDLSNALALVVGTQFSLQPMDVVFVTSTPSARWTHLLDQLLVPLARVGGISDSVGTVKAWFNR